MIARMLTPGTTTPCADRSCRTTRGFIRAGELVPVRLRGLCNACHEYHRRHGTLDQFPTHTGPRRLKPTWLVRQYKERVINLRVAMHEAGGLCPATPLVEGADNTARRLRNAERFVEAYTAERVTA